MFKEKTKNIHVQKKTKPMDIKRLFRKHTHTDPQPLQVQGVGTAPITPTPDQSELAAQALLEVLIEQRRRHVGKHHPDTPDRQPKVKPASVVAPHDKKYYHHLADRIRLAYELSSQRTQRFLAFCEQQLKKPDLPVTGSGSLQLLETELYKRIDIIDREGGKLKERWQHCLAEVTLRLMNANDKHEPKQDSTKPDKK